MQFTVIDRNIYTIMTLSTSRFQHRSRLMGFFGSLTALISKYEKRTASVLAVASVVFGLLTYLALSSAPPFGQRPELISVLLTLDVIIVLLLGAMILHRMVGLWLGRGQGASRLHMRMVAMFALLATAPAILLVIFSTFFFQMGVQSWFSSQVKTAVTEAQAVAEAYLEEHRKVIRADLVAMASDIDRQPGLMYADADDLTRFMDTQSFLRNFTETVIFNGSGRVTARGGVGLGFDSSSLPPGVLQSADFGDPVIFTTPDAEEKIHAVVKLNVASETYLYVNRSVDPLVLSYLSATRDASSNYANLEKRRGDVQFQFFAVYILVTLLLLVAAVWGGLFFAGQLVNPIENLIDAAEQVREGNLNTRVPEQQGMDEFDLLARAFNRMTAELEQQRRELITANHKLDERRRFTETILAGVTSGVMAVDAEGVIRLVNEPASRILALKTENILRQPLALVLPGLDLDELLVGGPSDTRQEEVRYTRRDQQERSLLVRMAPDAGGAILTFDDITELQSAQRKSAWSDVARRVAHEIKNPLTPIQLSAERLRRKFLKDIPEGDRGIFQQCVDTIIRHVGDIGRMVNEFASFGRMPEPSMKPDDLGVLVRDIAAMHQNAKPGVKVSIAGAMTSSDPLPILVDAAQMRQALTNLILNAAESVERRLEVQPDPAGEVRVYLQATESQYILSVLDNGMGFPKGVPLERLSEPYVTFREKGTGLGLAIVKKITEDHKGSMRLEGPDGVRAAAGWGETTGALVSLILPIPLDQRAEVRENKTHAA